MDFNNDFNNDFDIGGHSMTLKELIDSEPANAGRTDQQVLDWLNETVSRNKTSISGDEAFQATEAAGWTGLTAAEKAQWLAFCGRDTIDPFGSANVALVQAIFGGGSATVTNLAALRTEGVTRLEASSVEGREKRLFGLAMVNKVRNA